MKLLVYQRLFLPQHSLGLRCAMNSSSFAPRPPSTRGPAGDTSTDTHDPAPVSHQISEHSSVTDPCPCSQPSVGRSRARHGDSGIHTDTCPGPAAPHTPLHRTAKPILTNPFPSRNPWISRSGAGWPFITSQNTNLV